MTITELQAEGVTSAELRLVQGGIDTLTLTVSGAALDDDYVWEYGDEIDISISGTTVFRGWCRQLPRQGTAQAESHTYVFHGPAWFLDHLVFRQGWKFRATPDDPESAWISNLIARLKSGQNEAGAKVNTAVILEEAIDYAITAGKPLAKGTIAAGVDAPTDEFETATCMEVIQRTLRWMPDVVMAWNYATNPATLSLVPRSGLTTVSIPLLDGSTVTASEITPRYDQQVSAVVLTFRYGGGDAPYSISQKYPPSATGTEDNAIVANLDLESSAGSPGNYLRQDIVTADLPAPDATEAVWIPWLKSKIPWLNDPRISNIATFDLTGLGSWERELVEGTITPWMEDSGVDAEQITITGTIDYDLLDQPEGEVVKVVQGVPIAVTLTATDATTKEYKKFVPGSGGYREPVPVGLAQALHASLSQLHWEGSVTTVAAECRTDLRPGVKLNLTGAVTAWASMGAVVQNVSMDLVKGTVTATFGPPQHLTLQDMVALLKPMRTRRSGGSTRNAEDDDESDQLDIGGLGRDTNGSAGEPTTVRQRFRTLEEAGIYVEIDGETGSVVIIDTTGAETKEVRIRLADIPAAAAAAGAIELRELDYCDGTTAKKILVLASAPYEV